MDSHRDSCFEKIKATFDPAFSYIVIEDKGGYPDDLAFLKRKEFNQLKIVKISRYGFIATKCTKIATKGLKPGGRGE